MRKVLYMFLVVVLALAGCTKEDYVFNGENGIFVDGVKVVPIESAFVGGGVSNPSKGSFHRFNMYSEYYENGPSWHEVLSVVYINGFRYKGTEYTSPGQYLSFVGFSLGGAHGLDGLGVELDQGVYKGSNDLVKSVKVKSYYFGRDDVNGKQIEDSVIDISIKLKDSTVIDIKYKGLTPFDGYY